MTMDESSRTPLLHMRAWKHDVPGPPEKVLSLSHNIPRPRITSDTQVLVHLKYAALNPGASLLMQLCPSFLRTNPSIPEMDFAGQIVEVGSAVDSSRGLESGV